VPLEAFGITAVSIGLLVKEDAAVIWRGPMASSALTQLLMDVAWGTEETPLDMLVIDMPPGTGDIQLTLAQKVSLDGAVIVSTPQELALADVRRGAAMFEKTNTRVLGVIENMAFFADPATGAPIEIFGRGGARAAADRLGAPFLGEIPIDISLRASADEGRPLTACAPQTLLAARFMDIAAELAERLKAPDPRKAPPRILDVD
jgi:ATP-binding protein involved in chromosome partitioning